MASFHIQHHFHTILSCIFLGVAGAHAQNTVGVLSYDVNQTFPGYNLIFPQGTGTAYLVDNCGEIVNEWPDGSDYRPSNKALLDENGNLFLCKGRGVDSNPVIHAGGGGEKIEMRDWDNNLLWTFTYNSPLYRLHHDIDLLPNGNVLAIAWSRKIMDECIAAGRDSTLLPEGEVWSDKIIEIQTTGPDAGQIVWEWNAWDHLVQNYDDTKANYGSVADEPGRINLNYAPTNGGHADWLHINSVAYNPMLDQILLSVPMFNEIWIIDHSTTTEEAASGSGGQSGRGGDLLFRWGNPQAYDRGTEADQKLFFQHDAHWMLDFLDPNDPDYGKIMLFNNRVMPFVSSANIIDPGIYAEGDGGYAMENGRFLPYEFDWTYQDPDNTLMFSAILSSSQRLPSGNTLILAGRQGYAFEINPENEIVWDYANPVDSSSGIHVADGDEAPYGFNLLFAIKRYPLDFPGFAGKDLTPGGYIEENPDTEHCQLFTSSTSLTDANPQPSIFPNPSAGGYLFARWQGDGSIGNVIIRNALGRTVYQGRHDGDTQVAAIPIKTLPNGVYFVSVEGSLPVRVVVER